MASFKTVTLYNAITGGFDELPIGRGFNGAMSEAQSVAGYLAKLVVSEDGYEARMFYRPEEREAAERHRVTLAPAGTKATKKASNHAGDDLGILKQAFGDDWGELLKAAKQKLFDRGAEVAASVESSQVAAATEQKAEAPKRRGRPRKADEAAKVEATDGE